MNIQTRVGNEGVIACIVALVGLSTAVYLIAYDNACFLYYGDAAAHIVRARQYIDSQHVGIHNMGTVWLPLPHLMLLPFVAIDSLFYSGYASILPGIVLLVLTSMLMYTILLRLVNSTLLAFVMSVYLCLNPNLVYLALTPMNEMSLYFFITLSAYAWLQWRSFARPKYLVLCTAAVVCASLCRYEAWLVVAFLSMTLLFEGLRAIYQRNSQHALRAITLSVLCWTGVAFWFAWNRSEYGDAFAFLHMTYSVGTASVRVALAHHPLELFSILLTALVSLFGMLNVALSFVLMYLAAIRRLSSDFVFVLCLFSLPALFNTVALMSGYVQVDQWWWNWRYMMTFGLVLCVIGARALAFVFETVKQRSLQTLMVVTVGVVPFILWCLPQHGVATYNDARKSYDDLQRSATAVGEQFKDLVQADSVKLFCSYTAGQRFMLATRRPLHCFHILYAHDCTEHSFQDPYIVVSRDPSPETEIDHTIEQSLQHVLLTSYHKVVDSQHLMVFKRNW